MRSSVGARIGTRISQSVGTAGRSRLLVGAALGVVLLVATACTSSGASSPSSTKAKSGLTDSKSASVSVSTARRGSLGLVLIDQSGMTLYRYSPDGTGTPTCTGACAAEWPPLTLPAGTTHVAAGGGVSASSLGTIARPGGTLQVTYKKMPLYRFAGDTKPGDTKGQGVAGTWFVVPAVASPTTPTTPTTPTAAAQSTVTTPKSTGTGTSSVSSNSNLNPAAGTSPPATAPPATAPPATAPPATSPPATAPPATSPPATAAPPTTAPPTTSPPVTTPTSAPGGGYGY
jgi:predicted lipoprotein with Yx(FWY)xxD motif